MAVTCAALLTGAPATALASGSPVHVDPKSPVAKEYAIPLATARGAAPESGQTGALFGSGITSTSDQASAPTQTEATAPTQSETTAATQAQTAAPTRTQTTAATTATSVTSPLTVTQVAAAPAPRKASTVQAVPAAYKVLRPGSGSGVLWMILAAVLVIALGGAGGVALSRRR